MEHMKGNVMSKGKEVRRRQREETGEGGIKTMNVRAV